MYNKLTKRKGCFKLNAKGKNDVSFIGYRYGTALFVFFTAAIGW